VITNEVRIRDISRNPTNEWTPPIGAMGGPPAHELYRDLVLYAGLRLLRDRDDRPWVAMQDGERRRTFRVPSPELRGALDRFRMRRNLRPVPETDLEDFTRIVEARISDPDIRIPSLLDTSAPRIDPNDGSFPAFGPVAPARAVPSAPIRENVPDSPDPPPAPEHGPTARGLPTEPLSAEPETAPVVTPPAQPPVPIVTPPLPSGSAPGLSEPIENATTTVRSGPSWVMHAARSPVRTNPEPEPGRWPIPSAPVAPPPSPWKEETEGRPEVPRPPPDDPSPAPALQREVDALLEELEGEAARRPRIPRLLAPAPPWSEGEEVPAPVPLLRPPSEAISGGRATAAGETGTLPTYLRVLKNLVSHGGWLGTTTELARLTGEDPETVFASLLEYRPSLNQNNIVVATVEVEDGWRWLAVDRSKLQAGRPSGDRFGP
jgi:hypothetical protein